MKIFVTGICFILFLHLTGFEQVPLPPHVPVWDGNTVELKLHKIATGIYAIEPTTADTETTKGIPQATSGGFIVGRKGVMLIECFLNKRLFDQAMKLIRSVTDKPIVYAVNTSDHGDHCFTNYLLPPTTTIIQNEFAKENLSKNFEHIKQFMITLFGKGRGIEEARYRAANVTVAKNDKLTIDMGDGKMVELINTGTAQSPADLFVWMPSSKVFWAGNPFIAESPTIPWLFDGYFLEPANNLKKIYDMLPEDAIVIPGHGRITNKAGIKYTLDYVQSLQQQVTTAVQKGLTLEQTKQAVPMKEYDKGYVLFNWLHFNFNLPNAYKDISGNNGKADLIIMNGKVATMIKANEFKQAIAINDGIISAVGGTAAILAKYKGPSTNIIDAKGKTIIPGLNDSHIHAIREGLNYNAELRWDGVTSLKRAMEMLKEQAARTPQNVWIKVVGGWNEYQFEEKRQPTMEEINEAVPDKPVFISYLYGKAFVNKKGLEVLQYDKNTRYEGSLVELDGNGHPTGMLYAKQTPKAIYTTLALTTKLNHEERLNSTIQFYHELNKYGLTSVVDAGGGGQFYPDDYSVAIELARTGKLTLRTSYYLFAQVPGNELHDYQTWTSSVKLKQNDNMLLPGGYEAEGAGENLVASAADFENFLEPRIVLGDKMEADLEPVIRLFVQNRWPFRLHATYGESIDRMLNIFEKVNRDIPFNGLHWLFDHAETVTDSELQRIKKLGGGIAVQFRMFYQGELYNRMYGKPGHQIPPIKKMLRMGLPVGLGTDATRISTFNPWLCLYWATTGRTMGGDQFWPKEDVPTRFEALQLYTSGSAWVSGEEKVKGKIEKGQYADLVILNEDYFSIPANEIRNIHSLLTILNGKPVYGEGDYSHLNSDVPPVIPAWSPVKYYGGYQKPGR
jgi:hypothetical protein